MLTIQCLGGATAQTRLTKFNVAYGNAIRFSKIGRGAAGCGALEHVSLPTEYSHTAGRLIAHYSRRAARVSTGAVAMFGGLATMSQTTRLWAALIRRGGICLQDLDTSQYCHLRALQVFKMA